MVQRGVTGLDLSTATKESSIRSLSSTAVLRSERWFRRLGPLSRPADAILMYHSVGERGLYGNVSTERFRRDLTFLKSVFEIVDLPDVLPSHPSNECSDTRSKKVAVTFDDGYENFYTRALPIVRDLDVPVTVFVSPGFLDGQGQEFAYRFFRSPATAGNHNDPSGRRLPPRAVPKMLTDTQFDELIDDDRVTIGNHTCYHPDLSTITDRNRLDDEIVGAKRRLEDRFGITVDRFAYPYGRYSRRSLAVVRRSHDLAVTTRPGLLRSNTDHHRLPRVRAHESESRVRLQLSDLYWDTIDRGKRVLERRWIESLR